MWPRDWRPSHTPCSYPSTVVVVVCPCACACVCVCVGARLVERSDTKAGRATVIKTIGEDGDAVISALYEAVKAGACAPPVQCTNMGAGGMGHGACVPWCG